MGFAKWAEEKANYERVLNGSKFSIDDLVELHNKGCKISIPDPVRQSTPPDVMANYLANVNKYLDNLEDNQPANPTKVTEVIGANPKSASDVAKVRKALQDSPLIQYVPGRRTTYTKLITGPTT
jgi:hypothetical protein